MTKTDKPLVSIALCTYNGEKFVAKQIKSILSQTYSNIELIICDDASTDNTNDIIKSFKDNDTRVQHFINEKNIGFNKNFEKTFQTCSGDYIAVCDQDDIWLDDKIAVLVENIGENWLIFSNSELIDENDIPLNKTLLNIFDLSNRTYKSLILYNYITGHTCLISAQFLKSILPLPIHDYYDWYIAFIALYHKKAIYIDSVLTKYRVHRSSVVQLKIASGMNKSYEIIHHLETIVNYCNLSILDRRQIEKTLQLFKNKSFFNLAKLIYAEYKDLFPDLKHRKGLSKFIFSYKYAKKKALP